MRKTLKIYGIFLVVILVLLSGNITSGVIGASHSALRGNFGRKNVYQTQDIGITCYVNGVSRSRSISYESGLSFWKLFSAVIEANAVDPCGDITRMLKVRFIEMLGDLGLTPHGFSVERICSLIEPPWSKTGGTPRWSHLMPPRSSDEDNATLFFCSMAGAGWGFVIPPFMLPRPRLFMQWRGFYPDSSAVSVAEMATGRGVIARGTQVGNAYGFIGVGFAFAFPGAPAQFGFLGYSLMTTLQGADMTWYYANFPPLVMQVSPEDGAVEVPVSLSELRFTLKDYDFDKMTYNVVTSPDIGSGSDANVGNGEYSIPVNNLDSGTTYTWTVTVSDGTDTVEEVFSFTTEAVAPVVLNPFPAHGAKDVPMDITQLQFTLMDPQGDAMEYTVETSPDVGSEHKTGVYDGTFTVPVSGLTYGETYHWFVNVTDGMHWTREFFSFETVYPSQFDPFEFGWSYRKQIVIDHTCIPEDMTHFPFLISTSDSDLASTAQSDGGDILFMHDIGVSTRIYHDLESYTSSSGTVISWVDIPFLSSSDDTVFYMYYGNTDCIDQEYPEKTWDSNFKAVWHMNDATLTIISDSTSNSYTGTKIAANEPQQDTGMVGPSQNFDGENDLIQFADPVIPTGPKTISGWLNRHSTGWCGVVFASSTGISSQDAGTSWSFIGENDTIQFVLGNGAETSHFMKIWITHPGVNSWHYYTMTYDGTSLRIYIDGELVGTTTTQIGTEASPTYALRMGETNHASYNYYLNGGVDELCVSNVVRSENWIQLSYEMMSNPSDFFTVGPEIP